MTTTVAARLTELTVGIPEGQTRHARVVPVLAALNLEVRSGVVTALVGESGCGKSLAAAALCGLLPPLARVTGRIEVAGQDVGATDERRWRQLRGTHVGFVPQSAATSFTPVRTIGSQLAEVCRCLCADRSVDDLLSVVGLTADAAALYPHEMSGGMAQRAAIAAAIAGRPTVVVADEPTSALDPDNAGLVWQLLADAASDGAAVLVITHDLPSLIRSGTCDDVALMRAGTIVAQAPVAAMLADSDANDDDANDDDANDGYVRRFFGAAV